NPLPSSRGRRAPTGLRRLLFPLSHRLAEVGSGRDALEQQVHVIWHPTVRNHFERIRLEKGRELRTDAASVRRLEKDRPAIPRAGCDEVLVAPAVREPGDALRTKRHVARRSKPPAAQAACRRTSSRSASTDGLQSPDVKLRELAARLQCVLDGDGEIEIERVAAIHDAGPGDVTFLANRKYEKALPATRASAVILHTAGPAAPCATLRSPEPYLAFARAVGLFAPDDRPAAGVHAMTSVAPDVRLGAGVAIGAFVVVGAGATIGDRT